MRRFRLTCLVLILVMVAGCGGKNNTENTESVSTSSESQAILEDEGDETEEYVPNKDLLSKTYMVLNVDTTTQQIMLKDMQSTRRLLYSYNLETSFFDKYGEFISAAGLYPGKVVEIDSMDEGGLVGSLHVSNQVWELDKVTNYSIDEDRGILKIGVTNYRIPYGMPVFSDNIETEVSSIGENDILRLTGKDKDIWAVSVTTGHGTLSVINAEDFVGSLICVGDIYTLIKGDMDLEVPEGSYNVTVANDGYGGSIPVEIQRGGISTVDLSGIKAEGTEKFCKLTFSIAVPEAVISIDGTRVTTGEVLDVKYGRHVLSVTAPGYESWTKYLYVNSETANIILDMSEEAGAGNGQNSGNTSEDNKDDNEENKTDEEKRKDVELEYLTTIRDTVANMLNNISL